LVQAIWKVGVSTCSPALIYNEMIQKPDGLNGERIKSRLQKFRLAVDKEESFFFREYQQNMTGVNGSERTLTKTNMLLATKGSTQGDNNNSDSLWGGKAIAMVTQSVMADDDDDNDDHDDDMDEDDNSMDTNKKSNHYESNNGSSFSSWSNDIHQSAVQYSAKLKFPNQSPSRISLLSLTSSEKKSSLGQALQGVIHNLQTLADHVALQRHSCATSWPPMEDVDLDPTDILIMAKAFHTTFHHLGEGIKSHESEDRVPTPVSLPTIDTCKKMDRPVDENLIPRHQSRPPSPSPSLPSLDSQDDPLSSFLGKDNDSPLEVGPVGDHDDSIRFDTASPIHGVWTPDDDQDMLRECFLPVNTLPKVVSPSQAPMSPSTTGSEANVDDAPTEDTAVNGSSLGSDIIFPDAAWHSLTSASLDAIMLS
jgi:hypothetical protein